MSIKVCLLGLLFFGRLSSGYGDDCCLRKQVGDFFYTFESNENVDGTNCHSDCVYSRDGDQDSRYCFAHGTLASECQKEDDVNKTVHAIYSGLSTFLTTQRSFLLPEQEEIVNKKRALPAICYFCFPPDYCVNGECWNSDDDPPGGYIDYVNPIKDLQQYTVSHRVFANLSDACSDARIECYEKCLPKVLDELATCLQISSFHPLEKARCFVGAIKKIVSECKECGCQLLFLVFPKLKPIIQKLGFCKPNIKKQIPGAECNRDCQNQPAISHTCFFEFVLESVETDAEGRRADGRVRPAVAYNGQIPGPPIIICEGDDLKVHFTNKLNGNVTNADGSTNTTTLHFHGIREKSRPWSDGVPFVTQCPILPDDEAFSYGFNTDIDGAPPGTYWYHSHVGAQRTNGAYGALIIKPKKTMDDVIDNATNTLVLQEWYESPTNQVPVSILINGKGRMGDKKHVGEDEEILNFLKGKGGTFETVEYNIGEHTTNFPIFDVEPFGKKYRFRIIGAISQNVPLQVTIELHSFTAIAADSLDIQPVYSLDSVWLAAGERYDIIIETRTPHEEIQETAYKIKVSGTFGNDKHLCGIAWLRYPGQTIDDSTVNTSDCPDFPPMSGGRTLNPVPNNYEDWIGSPENGKYFIKDLKAAKDEPTINFDNLANFNTHYIEFSGDITFNNKRMIYPDIPFLLQDTKKSERCGSKCDLGVGLTQNHFPYLYTNCTELACPAIYLDKCECQHVIQQPWAPGYWAETVLINNNLDHAAAHPIHQHGGWYWVVGMGKYNHTIDRNFIKEQDKQKKLKRSFPYAPAKDTLQIPQRGYAIIRTKLDNAGAWIMHCHINYHVTIGMAMVLQIGELGDKSKWDGQNWCTGNLPLDTRCPSPPPNPGGGPTFINWFYDMEPVYRCVAPGSEVTWTWENPEHNVTPIENKEDFENCKVNNNATFAGDHTISFPDTGKFYYACGRENGGHCDSGMKAEIHVSEHCS